MGGGPRLISKLSVILLLIDVSKQKLLVSSTICYLRSAECFFHGLHKLRVVPHFSSGVVERAKRERAWKSPHAEREFFSLPAACRLFSRGEIFTRARVSLAPQSLRKNGELLVVYGLHDSLCNTIVVGSWINFRLSICCFVTQYIVVLQEVPNQVGKLRR